MSTDIKVVLWETSVWPQVPVQMEMLARNPTPISPEIRVQISGMDFDKNYRAFMSIQRAEKERLAFVNGKWEPSTKRSPAPAPETKWFEGRYGAQSGLFWNFETMDFNKIKISGKEEDKDKANVIFLPTMYKYMPVIKVVDVNSEEEVSFPIDMVSFIVVTGYQHPEIGKWKASHNKFAPKKHGGPGGCKRKRGEKSEQREEQAKKRVPLVPTTQIAAPMAPVLQTPVPVTTGYWDPCQVPMLSNYQIPNVAYYPSRYFDPTLYSVNCDTTMSNSYPQAQFNYGFENIPPAYYSPF